MPFVATGDIYRVGFFCRLMDQESLNVRHFAVTALTGTPTTQNLADDISTFFGPLYKALLCGSASYQGLKLYRIAPGTPTIDISVQIAGGGSGGNDPLPAQITNCATLRSDEPGRKNRGRIYIPFPSTDDSENTGTLAVPTDDYCGLVTTLVTNMVGLNIFGSSGHTVSVKWALWSPTEGIHADLTSYSVKKLWATQRKRGEYGRVNPPFPG